MLEDFSRTVHKTDRNNATNCKSGGARIAEEEGRFHPQKGRCYIDNSSKAYFGEKVLGKFLLHPVIIKIVTLRRCKLQKQQAADWLSHSKAADSLRFNRGVPRDHCNRAQHICRAGVYFRHTLKTLERLLRAALQRKCAERTFATDLSVSGIHWLAVARCKLEASRTALILVDMTVSSQYDALPHR